MIEVGDIVELRDGSRWRIFSLSNAEIRTEGGNFNLQDVVGIHHEVGTPLQYSHDTFNMTAEAIYHTVIESDPNSRDAIIAYIEKAFNVATGQQPAGVPMNLQVKIHNPRRNMRREGTWE